MRATQEPSPTESRWQDPERAAGYADGRFRGGHAGRDPRLVTRLIRRFHAADRRMDVLDVPAGTGRLHDALRQLAHRTAGVDVSEAMLRHSAYADEGHALVADARALPFADDSFEVVVACRLLHHLSDDDLGRVMSELSRVARSLVIASFWDTACVTETRKRLGLRRRTDARRSITRSRFRDHVAEAGGELLGYATSFRYFSPQTFAAWRP